MKITGSILIVAGIIVVYLSIRGRLEGTAGTLKDFLTA